MLGTKLPVRWVRGHVRHLQRRAHRGRRGVMNIMLVSVTERTRRDRRKRKSDQRYAARYSLQFTLEAIMLDVAVGGADWRNGGRAGGLGDSCVVAFCCRAARISSVPDQPRPAGVRLSLMPILRGGGVNLDPIESLRYECSICVRA